MKCRQIRDYKRRVMVSLYETKRRVLKTIKQNSLLPVATRYQASFQLSRLPINSSATRVKNFCLVSQRSRAVYRYLHVSRIALRDFGYLIPGLIKSSW